MTFTVATHNEEIGIFFKALNVKASDWIPFDRLIDQSLDLLFALIKQTNRSVATSNSDKIFNRRNTVYDTLRHIDIAVKSISYFIEKFLVHQPSLLDW